MIDINISEGEPTINDEVDLIIQQVDLLFDTTLKEVHGAPSYGTRYDDFLYDLGFSNAAIEYQIQCDLGQLELFGYIPLVKSTILEGTNNDIILIEINLTKDNRTYSKVYRIG